MYIYIYIYIHTQYTTPCTHKRCVHGVVYCAFVINSDFTHVRMCVYMYVSMCIYIYTHKWHR